MTKKIDKTEGKKHIHNIMHTFIEGLAAGIYVSVDDIQRDAQEYLAMERVVDKLANWKPTDKIEDLTQIFEGLSNSIEKRREEQEWAQIMQVPKMKEDFENPRYGDNNVK